jgi:hypothetical protein
LLRREKIRNTGKRFKLQTIIMRYNTFQQYWQRICREIENGTYKRHLARADRILGADQMLTIAARRRFGKAAAAELAAQAEADDVSPLDEIESGDEAVRAPSFRPEQSTTPPALPAIPRAPVPMPMAMSLPPNAPTRTARPSKYESLNLDMDFLDSWDPERSVRQRQRGASPADAPPEAPPPKPVAAKRPPPPESARPPIAAKAAALPLPVPSALPPRPFPSASPPRPSSSAVPPRPASRPVAPGPRLPAPSSRPVAQRPLAKPVTPARGAPPPKPQKPAPRAAEGHASKPSGLSDARIKELHENLVRIKRENKEAGQVSIESLAKTLRATEEKLRAEHKNRRIEFEVVVRDGKAVVKPKVR